ncbi:hypothetical protein [Ligilactobacillus sp.]|uniref:hypothetical protein n=1 Tax=Ligilactobacillus sp. TaxID=2767921 RepID=UPI002FE1A76D
MSNEIYEKIEKKIFESVQESIKPAASNGLPISAETTFIYAEEAGGTAFYG